MKLTSIVLALLALAAGLVIAGCGDDEEEPQTLTGGATGASGATGDAGATGSKAAFIEAADKICSEASAELAAASEKEFGTEGPPTGRQAERLAEEFVVPSLQEQHDQIAALDPPEGEEEAVDDILTKLQAGIDEIAEDPRAFVEARGGNAALDEATKAAKDFGLTACGEG